MSTIYKSKDRLNYLINIIPQKITHISSQEISYKRAPDKWSKKEIIGHLCDSAINNLSRFIRVQFEPKPFLVVDYEQTKWVSAGKYQEMSMDDILSFWKAINKNIINVISKIPAEDLKYECYFEGNDVGIYVNYTDPDDLIALEKKQLKWLIDDYVAHMEYHLKQVIGNVL